jgi:hypothetical protein
MLATLAFVNEILMKEPIIVFSHIPKTAGMNLHSILRRHFGINHLGINSSSGKKYTTYESLKQVLTSFPHLKSIGGHGMQAWVDYKEFEQRLKWYTFLRKPLERVLSHYQHQTLRKTHHRTFEEFLNNKPYQNWSVKMLAGEDNIDKAKQILHEKFLFVGLTERFNESLLLMRKNLQLQNFDPRYTVKVNVAKSNSIAAEIKENLSRYEDMIYVSNRLDMELYTYAETVIFPEQLIKYGGIEKMNEDMQIFTESYKPTIYHHYNTLSNFLFRNAIVKFYMQMHK